MRIVELCVFILLGGCATAERSDGTRAAPVDKESVRQVFRQHLPEVRGCYEAFLRSPTPIKEGKIVLRVLADSKGHVTDAMIVPERTTLNDAGLDRCLSGQALTWTFPALAPGETLDVVFPYFFD